MRPSPVYRRFLGIAAALAATSLAAAAAPQVAVKPRLQAARAADAEPARAGTTPLRRSHGVPVAERLLASGDPEQRLRGIARLGAIGTPEAIDVLLEALDQGSPAGRDSKARIEGVRALARHAQRDGVRQLLTRELTDGGIASARGSGSPLADVLRGTAALALARAGDKRGLGVLANAIVQGGAAGDAAARALKAYPPASLELLLGARKKLPPALAAFLGDLGDLRAFEVLRATLRSGDKAAQLAAGLALARLGDGTALPMARAWLRSTEPGHRETAAEMLVYLGSSDAASAIAALLKAELTRDAGLRLAELSPAPELAAPLAHAVPLLSGDAQPRAVAAVGRAGGADAARELSRLVRHPELATSAAFALATLPGPEARAGLDELLASPRAARDPALLRLALRAAIVRGLVLDDAPAALEERLRAGLAAPSGSADRAVAVFGAVALGRADVEALTGVCALTRCEDAAIHAAARGALAHGGDALAPFAGLFVRLATARGALAPPTIAAGVALLHDPSGGALTTTMLADLADAGGPLAPLAARALATRDDEVIRGRLNRLLQGTDPVVRAHVALGLGLDPMPDAVSLLARAYRFEDEAAVRQAIVRGLSLRAEVQRKQPLLLARDLDPDEGVRSLARAALEGRSMGRRSSPLATGVVWLSIVPNDSSVVAGVAARAARLLRPDGLAVPVVADPDGVLLVPGVDPGPSSVRLAPAAPKGDAAP